MKKRLKLLLTAACCLVLILGSVFGTLAYLTSQDEAVNTFTVGQVNITVDEAKVDAYGNPEANADRVGENTYKLIPGKTYTKDPTMTVIAGSEPSYVRMLVTINKISVFKDALDKEFYPHEHIDGWKNEIWEFTEVTEDADNDSRTYEFRYVGEKSTNGIVSAVDVANNIQLEPLFTKFIAPSALDSADLGALNDFTITVVGHAIQAEGFNDADAAWAAFDDQVRD